MHLNIFPIYNYLNFIFIFYFYFIIIMNTQKCLENIQSILFIIIVIFLLYKFYRYYVDNQEPEHFNNINDLNKSKNDTKINLLNETIKNDENIKNIKDMDIDDMEPFTDKLIIKKTNKYKLVLSSETFSVWEPENIDEYFSIGQFITLDDTPPDKEAILIKSTKMADDYELITQFKSFGIWKPLSNDPNYDFVSYIFNEKKPSKNKIRPVHKDYLHNTNITNILLEIDSKFDDKYNIWDINNSDYFIVNDKDNKDKLENVYTINNDMISPYKPILVKTTKSFTKIWEYENTKNNKKISVWRPNAENNYKILGDIVLDNKSDPNDTLEIPTIHNTFTTPVLYFDSEPVVFNYKLTETEETNIQFWKPKLKDGYVSFGDIVTVNSEEPLNDIMASIPLEYVMRNNGIVNMWNSIDKIFSCWSNNYFCNAFKSNNIPNKPLYKLNDDFIEPFYDQFDNSKTIILEFEPKNLDLELDVIKNEIKTKLSTKLEISRSRLIILKYKPNNENKIFIDIKPKPYNSEEDSTQQAFDELVKIVFDKKIKINHNNMLLMIISNISVEKEEHNNIKLDNKLYLETMTN